MKVETKRIAAAWPGASVRRISSDNNHYAVIYDTGYGEHVIHDDFRHDSYDRILPDSLVFSPNGRRLAYATQKGSSGFLVVNRETHGPFDGLGTPVFSPDSRCVACIAAFGNRHGVVLIKAGLQQHRP